MKSIQLYLDMQKLGLLNEHFYLHNKKLLVTKIINYDERHISYIAELSRSDFVDENSIISRKEEIIKRYSLETFEILSVDRRNNSYRVLIVQKLPEIFSYIYEKMNYKAFILPPIMVSRENMMVTVIIKDDATVSLLKILDELKIPYKIIKKTVIPREKGLTIRQWEIAITAIRQGYYSIPKKVKLKDIARKFKISVPAVQRILRSVEIKAIEDFFSPFF